MFKKNYTQFIFTFLCGFVVFLLLFLNNFSSTSENNIEVAFQNQINNIEDLHIVKSNAEEHNHILVYNEFEIDDDNTPVCIAINRNFITLSFIDDYKSNKICSIFQANKIPLYLLFMQMKYHHNIV